MTVEEGFFQLYSHIVPVLPAGDYRFTTGQDIEGHGPHGDVHASALPVEELETYVRVTSPRFQLPPDQVLSTYPPANTEGAYGSTLPQIVIKRRTLPWERTVDPENESDLDREHPRTPWLALVVIAEGEAELVLNRPVSECVTPGQELPGEPDVAQGNYLRVRRSVVDRVLPTQKDVPLLAHAREVDIHDTEMMMGDDDGFLSVVIANRLPVPARDAEGHEVPVTYLCALINLEGQFAVLRPETVARVEWTFLPLIEAAGLVFGGAESDHIVMGTAQAGEIWDTKVAKIAGTAANLGDVVGDSPQADTVRDGAAFRATRSASVVKESRTVSAQLREGWATGKAKTSDSVYDLMAKPFGTVRDKFDGIRFDPEYRFPALLHWSFTSVGEVTFRGLMDHLDSGLLGTLPPEPATPPDPLRTPGRTPGLLPLEIVETGHVGIDQRTRRGDTVRAWYRGPLLPHPADTAAPRLPLAHTADQLRGVVPDRREDLSLAVAFEIGRLLALSTPAMISALLAWRQTHYQTARREAEWADTLEGMELDGVHVSPDRMLGVLFGRGLARQLADTPGAILGDPLDLVTAGTTMGLKGLNGGGLDGDGLAKVLAGGLAIDADLAVPLADLSGIIRKAPLPVVDLGDLPGHDLHELTAGALHLDHTLATGLLAVDALGLPAQFNPILGAGTFGPFDRIDLPGLGGVIRGPGRPGGPDGPGRGPVRPGGPGRPGRGPRPRAADSLDEALDGVDDSDDSDDTEGE